MKNKKLLGVLLGFAMFCSLAIPGVWAMEAGEVDTGGSIVAGSVRGADSGIAVKVEPDLPNSDAGSAPEESAEEGTDAEPDVATSESAAADSQQKAATQKQPVQSDKAEATDHIAGCSDDCTKQDCACSCHEQSLFDRLMACNTFDEMLAIADTASEEEILALTDEENAQIEAKAAALEPEAMPPAEEQDLPEETTDEQDAPVPSEIVYPTVNFDQVAPFGAPVEG